MTRRKRAFSRTRDVANTITIPSTSAAALPASTSSRTTIDDYSAKIRHQKLDELVYALDKETVDSSEVWSRYIALLEYTHYEPLPAALHRRVLHNCAPPPQFVRNTYVKSLKEVPIGPNGDAPQHPLEKRFAKVQEQLHAAGGTLMREDYLVLLKQYAAVGAHMAAAALLAELRDYVAAVNSAGAEHSREARSLTREYTLVLQALSFRLSLPCVDDVRVARTKACAQLAELVIDALQRRHGAVLPPACRDLALRVLKDVGDEKAFTALLARSGGVDIAYLDRHALPFESEERPPAPLTTATLTTIVDYLGGRGDVSKMVAAFEVLSTEYTAAKTNSAVEDAFDDEDDDTFAFTPGPTVTERPLPSARPNITTYNFLIRHCARTNNVTLTRHYVQRALELDRITALHLREEYASKPLAEIARPDLQVNVDTLRPLVNLAGREKDVQLMKWALAAVRWLRKKKKEDFEFFAEILMKQEKESDVAWSIMDPQLLLAPGSTLSSSSNTDKESTPDTLAQPPLSFFTSTSSTSFSTTSLDTALSQPSSTPPSTSASTILPSYSPPPTKAFDLALHVRLLVRDRAALKTLDARVGTALTRVHSRNKERLGRRVWAGADVYIADVGRRTTVSREDWVEKVNFGVPPHRPPNSGNANANVDIVAEHEKPEEREKPFREGKKLCFDAICFLSH